jgi:hypothetical protein
MKFYFKKISFRSKLELILTKASLSHRRESLWERLIASRSDNPIAARQEVTSININEFQALLDSCIGDEIMELNNVVELLQRVFPNKEQSDRLCRFLRSKYGSQFHMLNSSTVNYLVRNESYIFAYLNLILFFRSYFNVKHHNNVMHLLF